VKDVGPVVIGGVGYDRAAVAAAFRFLKRLVSLICRLPIRRRHLDGVEGDAVDKRLSY
jgi:hypothetical protein